jgi:hypothetical protein
LEDGGARLRTTREELRRREQELERTSDLTREVAQDAADLLHETRQIADHARRTPLADTNTDTAPSPRDDTR